MKVNFTPYNFSFKSDSIPKLPKEGLVLGYDDSISAQKREAIREHLETQTSLIYQKYYGIPKSDYEMEKMLKSWGLKIDNITKNIIIPPYLNSIALENNNFRGALPRNFADYKKLKESGITTVISATPRSGIKNRKFIDELIKSVRAWQNGCCFIGCQFGTNMTSNAISVVDAFNPKGNGIASDYLSADEKNCVISLYKKLTEQDKKLMGWTKEFEKSFLKRMVRV